MKKVIFPIFLVALILSCSSTRQNSTNDVAVQTPEVVGTNPTIYGNTITAEELKEMLYVYASDEFEGRETGEPGQKKAVNYLKEQYMNMGIASPLSGDDYFQEVPLEKQKLPEVAISINGTEFKNYEDYIAIGSAASTTIDASEIVYAGYGIEDENYSSYKNLDVKGKVVLIKSGEPKNADGTYVTSGTKETTKWVNGRQARASKGNVAKEKGAKAIILMDDNDSFKRLAYYYEAASKSSNAGRISLKSNEAELYQFLVTEKLGKALYAKILDDAAPKTIQTSISIDVKGNSEEVSSENVVAFIKGTDFPNEIVVISAHLDHEGIKNGEVYNGADDDGSGTIAILEIAEAFKKAADAGHGPKRSILFLHVTGEEKGLLGSKYYTDYDPIFPLENTVANLNIDMIGRIDPKRNGDRNYIYLIGSDKLSTDLHKLSETVNKKYTNITLDYTYNDENDPNRFYYRSDHYNFAKNNIPIIFYFNGTHADYHKPSDTPDKIEYDLLENRTRLVFYTAWEVANRANKVVVDKAQEVN
ncbi:M28 family peptidase [Geojedonia litorea]|uniref:M28 family peptidase n=1 Tax=Geojedonia litorea TaxID=1268269 RepID=A0ABV9N2W8_9FLAO